MMIAKNGDGAEGGECVGVLSVRRHFAARSTVGSIGTCHFDTFLHGLFSVSA